jgi:hypothetical protein
MYFMCAECIEGREIGKEGNPFGQRATALTAAALQSQSDLRTGNILWGVYTKRTMASLNHTNRCAVFEGAKLLELFGAFEPGGSPAHELHDKIQPVAVDADMPEGLKAGRESSRCWDNVPAHAADWRMRIESCRLWPFAIEGDKAARKIECSSVQSRDDFDIVGIERFGGRLKGTRGSYHVKLWVALESSNESVDEAWLQGRLITLNIDDMWRALQIRGDLCNPVGTARMPGRREGDFGAEVECGFSDSHIVGRDDDP